MKKFFRLVFGRVAYTLLFAVIQLSVLFVVLGFFEKQFVYFYSACLLLSAFTVLHVLNRDMNPAYKIVWLVLVLLFPIFGGLMYLMFGKTSISKKEAARAAEIEKRHKAGTMLVGGSEKELRELDEDAAVQSSYITAITGTPPYTGTKTTYFTVGEEYFEALKNELSKAEHFIFLEYFIIREGKMWDEILEILKKKAAAGVDVRVIYDDLGCCFTLPRRYDKELEKMGIKACIFNRFTSVLNLRFNTRDHRKICVIDGNTGFTGGINLSDEYINEFQKYGHWKDSGIMLKGKAVWSLTLMFLSLWDFIRKEQDDFALYAPNEELSAGIDDDGFVQPYTDAPFDNEQVGRTVYTSILGRAKSYVYITTPYLIIDSETAAALKTAACSGIDVRIIVPGIPDSKAVDAVTKSYYEPLLRGGVRIYEYTPGFIHAKNFVSDDKYAVVGTINLDYRSLYLHYECAAWLYKTDSVEKVKEDYLCTLEKCTEITLDSIKRKSAFKRMYIAVLKTFAPLM